MAHEGSRAPTPTLGLDLNNDDVTVIPLQDFLVPLSICLHVEVVDDLVP